LLYQQYHSKSTMQNSASSKSKQSNDNRPKIYKCSEFNAKNVKLGEWDTTDKVPASQRVCYPKYNDGSERGAQVTFRTGPIKFVSGGITPMNENTKAFITSDADREFFRVPWDTTQAACNELFNVLEQIDEVGQQEMRRVLGDSESKKYTYTKLVKDAPEPRENTKDKNAKPRHQFKNCKVKFAMEFVAKRDKDGKEIRSIKRDPQDIRNVETAIFVRQDGKPTLMNTRTISDVNKYFNYNCTARFVVTVNKFWAMKLALGGSPTKMCGMSLKCVQLEVLEVGTSSQSNKEMFKSVCVTGDDDEADVKTDGNDSKRDGKDGKSGSGGGPAPKEKFNDDANAKESSRKPPAKEAAKEQPARERSKESGRAPPKETAKEPAKDAGKNNKNDKNDKTKQSAKPSAKPSSSDNDSDQEVVEVVEEDDDSPRANSNSNAKRDTRKASPKKRN